MHLAPKPHQEDALAAITAALAGGGRAQVQMACGTGKTLVGRWAAQRLGAAVTVVACPSIALVAQTVKAWRDAQGWDFESVLVCSDPTTAEGIRERADGEPDRPWWVRYGARVTTEPGVVLSALKRTRQRERPLVIFSTHHSAPVVAQALTSHGHPADLVVADEAHHLAGAPRTEFRTLTDGTLPATATLYMTATRVTSHPAEGALLMSDTDTFGELVYRLTFSEAIAADLLSDFRVLVYETSDATSADGLSAFVSGADGDSEVSRVLSFHGRVAKARTFAADLDGHTMPDGRTIAARAVAGTDAEATRRRALSVLDHGQRDQVALVSSARCLSEGVDLPVVDTVLFADPKTSAIDITQAVGRVLRKARGKTRGTVLVPVVVQDGIDDDVAASGSRYRHVWKVLQALRAVDPQIAAEIDGLATGVLRDGPRARRGRFEFRTPSIDDLTLLVAREASTRRIPLTEWIGRLRDWQATHGDTFVSKSTSLGLWVARQRALHRCGALDEDVEQALEQVPGWVWSLDEAAWTTRMAVLRDLAHSKTGLNLDDPEQTGRKLARIGNHAAVTTVGVWCAQQRAAAREGTMPAHQQAALSALPGWTWHPTDVRDEAMVDLLREYVAWKHDANVPQAFTEDGLDLGMWLRQVRRSAALDRLPQTLRDDVVHATSPTRGTDGELRWYRRESQWLAGWDALNQLVRRTGSATVPYRHVETMPDGAQVDVHAWATRQRYQRRHGTLPDALAAHLESVPGWWWEAAAETVPRVRKDIGDRQHGTRAGYRAGCPCEACLAANRGYNARHKAMAAAGERTTTLVPVARAKGHLLILLGQGATRRGLVRATGVSRTSLSKILDGRTSRVTPAVQDKILATTMADVRQDAAKRLGGRVDAAPTWALLDDLLERGFTGGKALQIRRDLVTRANAQKVADLHERIGNRRPPTTRQGVPRPTLAEMIHQENQGRAA